MWDRRIGRPPFESSSSPLERGDLRGSGALGARLGDVGNLRALGEGLEPVAGDGAVVDEQILGAVIGDDEAEPLVVAEPLHCAGAHYRSLHRNVCCAFAEELLRATTAGAGTASP